MVKNTAKQKVLALMFALVMVSGFAIVWATAQYYDSNNVVTQLYITDSDSTYGDFLISDNFLDFPAGNVTSKQASAIGIYFNETFWTPAYLGNNSWGVSVEEHAVAEYDSVSLYMLLNLPQLDNWIIDYVLVNQTAPTEDNKLVVDFFHFDAPFNVEDDGSITDTSQLTEIYRDETGDTVDSDLNMTVSLAEALRIYDLSQETTADCFRLAWAIDDPLGDGLTGYSWTWTIEIWGHAQTTTSLKSVLSWGIGGAIFMNIIVILYMTDKFDIGGYVRDIPKKAKRGRR